MSHSPTVSRRALRRPSLASQRGSMQRGIMLMIIAAVLFGVSFFGVKPAQTAPQVEFTPLQGEPTSMEALRGKVVLVNFWATSCTTCVAKMPMIVETFEQHRDQGFEVMAVAMQYDPPEYVKNFAESRELPFAVVLDTEGGLAQAFGDVQLTPTGFLVGRDGKVLKRYLGDVDEAEFKADVAQALGA